jgi:uncharacterized protein
MAKSKSCPECGDTVADQFRPFCSKRCADVDLHRWLTGAYAIPSAEEDEPGDDDETSVQPVSSKH